MLAEAAFQRHSSLAETSKPEEDITQADSRMSVPRLMTQTERDDNMESHKKHRLAAGHFEAEGCAEEGGAKDGGRW